MLLAHREPPLLMEGVGLEFIVNETEAVPVQPFLFVTVTEYMPVELALIDSEVAEFDHE